MILFSYSIRRNYLFYTVFRVQAQTYYQKFYDLKASHQCVLGNEADKKNCAEY